MSDWKDTVDLDVADDSILMIDTLLIILHYYYLLDFNFGYSGINVKKLKLDTRVSIINALNTFYISDAQNNSLNNDFNASASTVNVGMGRRWQISLVATF